jgi:hypothetical protein
MDNGRPDPSADAECMAGFDQFSRHTERAGDILDDVTRFKSHQFMRGFSNGLDDQCDRSLNRIGIGNGERNTLASVTPADDYELAGLADLRNARRLDVQSCHIRT